MSERGPSEAPPRRDHAQVRFVVLIVALMVRPYGLFGREIIERV